MKQWPEPALSPNEAFLGWALPLARLKIGLHSC